MNTPANAPARNTKVMNRFDLTSRLVAKLKNEEAVIGGIGNTNFDLWAAGHRPQNFYMLGSMGLAFPIALGVALAQPNRRVFALEGDGSLLMQLGCLSTIAMLAPKNLTHDRDGQRHLPDHRRAADAGRRGRRYRRDRASAAALPTAPGPPTRRISSGWSIRRSRRRADLIGGASTTSRARPTRTRSRADPGALHARLGRPASVIGFSR